MGPKAVSPAGKCCCTARLSVLLWIHLDRYLRFVLSQQHVQSLGPVLMLGVHRAGRIIGAGVLNVMFMTRNSRMALTWTLTLCNYAVCWLTAQNFFHLLLFPTNKGNMDNVCLFPLIFFHHPKAKAITVRKKNMALSFAVALKWTKVPSHSVQ